MGQVFTELGLLAGEVPLTPTNLPEFFANRLLAPYPALRMQSPRVALDQAVNLLGVTLKQLHTGEGWPADAAQRLLSGMKEREIKVLYGRIEMMPVPVYRALVAAYPYRKETAESDTSEILGYRPVPVSLYQLCSDVNCASTAVQGLRASWKEGDFFQNVRWIRKTARFQRAWYAPHPKPHPDFLAHLELLERASTSVVLPPDPQVKKSARVGRP